MFTYDLSIIEKKQRLQRAANCIGAAYAFMFLLEYAFVEGMRFFLPMLGKDVYNLFAEGALSPVTQIVYSVLLFTLPYIVAVSAFGGKISQVVSIKKPKKGSFLPLFLLGLLGCRIGEVFSSMWGTLLENIGIFEDAGEHYALSTPSQNALTFLMIVVVPPLVEEFAMRGVALGTLRPFGDGVAIIGSAVLFALMHRSLYILPFAFMAGLALGFAAVKSGSIWTGVAIHAANNLFSLLVDWFVPRNSALEVLVLFVIILVVCLGLVAFYRFSLKRDDAFSLDGGVIDTPFSQKLKWFFSSPGIVIAVIITVLFYIIYMVLL